MGTRDCRQLNFTIGRRRRADDFSDYRDSRFDFTRLSNDFSTGVLASDADFSSDLLNVDGGRSGAMNPQAQGVSGAASTGAQAASNAAPAGAQATSQAQGAPTVQAPIGAVAKMGDNQFDYNCARARAARLGKVLNNFLVKALLALVAILLAGGGLLLVLTGDAAGWMLVAIGDIFAVVAIWGNSLRSVPVGKNGRIGDILSTDVLQILSKNPTPTELAQKLSKTQSGGFLAVRYGMLPQVLENMVQSSFGAAGQNANVANAANAASVPSSAAQNVNTQMEAIFQHARAVQKEVGLEVISGGALTVGLVRACSTSEMILKQMRLEEKDLVEGVKWFARLHGQIKQSKIKPRTGGIARDFSFGFIPLLQRYGYNLSAGGAATTKINRPSQREAIDKMIETFSKNGRQNVALIGADGTGRSTVVKAFADEILDADNKKIPANLKFRQVFKLDAGAIIGSVAGQGDVERLVNALLNEAFRAKNIIIYLDNAHLFFEDGVGSMNLSNLLTPVIEAGVLRMILVMDQQKFLEISARNAQLTNALNKIQILPADEAETMEILEEQVPYLEYQQKVTYTIWALKEGYRLSQRYIHDLEMPGRALNLLEAAAGYANNGFVMGESVATAVEKTQGVKLGGAVNTDSGAERNRLMNMEALIHERMIDQEEAVRTISDALRRAAAGVRNENKPIGTFLFLGPTGVGKTELAKSVSDVYFGGESDLVRVDLNEYVTQADVARLIAAPEEDAMSLTAQVTKNPFSVVLLDEIEKAHPLVLTTLLQMLDEGILRDTRNHEVSFRDAIVVATSNAGANQIREWVTAGRNVMELKEQLTNALIQSGEFKPEFLNRFDEICLFKPLSMEDCLAMIDLMINSVNKTLAPQKVTVHLDENAKRALVEMGYDPQLGARPMRRIVQKTVENVVAKMMLSGAVSSGAEVVITEEMVRGAA